MYGQIDIEDAVAAPLFTLAAAVSTGIADVSIFGQALSAEFAAVSGTSFTYAFLIAILALGFAWVTNEPDLDSMDEEHTYAVMATFGIIIGAAFVPGLNDFVTSSDIVGIVAMSIEAAGYYAVSYLG